MQSTVATVEDLVLDVIGDAICPISVKKFIETYEAALQGARKRAKK